MDLTPDTILTEPRSCFPLCSGNCGPCEVWIPSVLESDLVPVMAKEKGKESLIPLCRTVLPNLPISGHCDELLEGAGDQLI